MDRLSELRVGLWDLKTLLDEGGITAQEHVTLKTAHIAAFTQLTGGTSSPTDSGAVFGSGSGSGGPNITAHTRSPSPPRSLGDNMSDNKQDNPVFAPEISLTCDVTRGEDACDRMDCNARRLARRKSSLDRVPSDQATMMEDLVDSCGGRSPLKLRLVI